MALLWMLYIVGVSSNFQSEALEDFDVNLLQTELKVESSSFKPKPTNFADQERKRAVFVVDLTGDEPDLKTEVEHLSKCGGTFAHAVVGASVGENNIPSKKFEGSEFVPKESVFSIGLVRNPYSFLVSLWSFGPRGVIYRNFSPEEVEAFTSVDKMQGLPAGTSQLDRDRFKKFVYRVSDDVIGELSKEFYGKYLDNYTVFQENVQHEEVWWTKPARDVFMSYPRGPVQEALAAFQAPGQLDCFAQTEHLEEDLRHCLEIYEQQAGPGSVDWVAFDEAAATVKQNPSDHVACNLFYDGDDNLTAFVAKTESEIMRAFNYSDRSC